MVPGRQNVFTGKSEALAPDAGRNLHHLFAAACRAIVGAKKSQPQNYLLADGPCSRCYDHAIGNITGSFRFGQFCFCRLDLYPHIYLKKICIQCLAKEAGKKSLVSEPRK